MSHLSPEADLLVAALRSLPIAVVTTNVRGVVSSINAALTSLTGYSAEEAVGQPISTLFFGTAERSFYDIIQEAIQSGAPRRGEWVCLRRNGAPFTAQQTFTSIKCPNGEILVLVTIEDTTGRKQVEEDVRLSMGRPETEEQTTGAGTWVWNCATGQIEGSSEWSKLHGLALRTTVPNWEGFTALLHPEDRARVVSQLEEDHKARSPHLSTKYRVMLPDGQIRWIGASGRYTYDDFGRPVRMAGVCFDVTERERLDQFATEAQRDFERFFNLIPDLACIVSADGYFKKVNPAWEITLGYTREEVLRTPMLEFIHPDDLDRTVNEIGKQNRQYRTKQFVNRYRCKDGSYRIFDWRTTFNRDESTRFGIAKDITEQRLWEESLRESEERFRIMADSCPTLIWVTDAAGKTQLANRTCREFFGAAFEQVDGDEWRSPIHPDDRSEYVGRFLVAVRERAPFRAEARVRRSDGEWRWIASYAEPRSSPTGEFLGHVGISPDITDRKQSEAALQRAKDAAEAANRLKSEFLANMSHELRTPMNGVIGLTDLALDTELTSEQRGYLEDVNNSATSLLRILNDILDFSKIEAGKLEFERIEFDLRQTVQEMLKVLDIRAAAKNLELACDLDPGVPSRLLGDPGRLRQILINLTGNAIKFTERGEVVIRVERWSETAEQMELHFSVKDTGIGIPLKKQQHVFSAFSQADSSSTRIFGGTGLGLTISSQLVEMMGGRIWLESEEGIGSTFHFTLPLGIAPARPEEELPGDSGFFEGLSVLVVDDNDTNRSILDKMLSNRGLKTTLADSGSAALEALQHAAESGNAFKLIVLDAHMPGMDGFTLAPRIKADPQFGGAEIALLTCGAQRGDADRCRDLGISACLAKPVGEMELLEAFTRMLQPAARRETRPEPSPRYMARAAEPGLRLLVVEDNLVNSVVTRRLLEKQNHTVRTATNGREALNMIEKEKFDCVLMDVQMPVLDGFGATAAIRNNERVSGGHLPIIALTAHAIAGDLERCLAAGMDGYLTKPANANDVFATVERVLRALKKCP
jgi:two-component system, sensor histidine kinase and response regulator